MVSAKAAGVPVAVGTLEAICTAAAQSIIASADCAAVCSGLGSCSVLAAPCMPDSSTAHVPRATQCITQRTRAATSAAVGLLAANTSGGLK